MEQAAILAQLELIALTQPAKYKTILTLSDNTPAISRFTKGAVTSDKAPAYLCRAASLAQREHRYCPQISFINGVHNSMADDASRLQQLTDSSFLHHFNQCYPQENSWQLLHLPTLLSSKLNSLLRCNSPAKQSHLRPAKGEARSLASGKASAEPTTSEKVSLTSQKTSDSTTSWSSACPTAKLASVASKSALEQFAMPYWRWGRGSPTWVQRIPETSKHRKTRAHMRVFSQNSLRPR